MSLDVGISICSDLRWAWTVKTIKCPTNTRARWGNRGVNLETPGVGKMCKLGEGRF